ncbi:hypothetical protein [Vreelandella massiliensis]|uniref:hypothetical protein n=1 Tax=Vreelandella massiliensis TaxID=1816686 RepID=UPI00096A88FF|nr:hypothetical protein [Halomonas massiliensis]
MRLNSTEIAANKKGARPPPGDSAKLMADATEGCYGTKLIFGDESYHVLILKANIQQSDRRRTMYAIEFEADIKSEFLRIPQYEQLKNQHVKVILLTESPDISATGDQHQSRKPASVPPIHFKGDIFTTVTDPDWFGVG